MRAISSAEILLQGQESLAVSGIGWGEIQCTPAMFSISLPKPGVKGIVRCFLFPCLDGSSVYSQTRRIWKQVLKMLSWIPSRVQEPPELLAANSDGVTSGSTSILGTMTLPFSVGGRRLLITV